MAGRQKKKQSSSSWRPILNPILYTVLEKQTARHTKKGQVSTAANKIKLCQTKQVCCYNRRHDTIYHNNTVLSTAE